MNNDFWNDSVNSGNILKQINILKSKTEGYKKIKQDYEYASELLELVIEEVVSLKADLSNVDEQTLPNDIQDELKELSDLLKQIDKDLENLLNSLREGKTMNELTANMKLYNYFFQSYDAIFHEYIGEYEIATVDEQGNKKYVKKYGLKAFSPIAKNYYFSHYKDFGSARSYGYRRVHLGNDLLRKYWDTYCSCRIWLY